MKRTEALRILGLDEEASIDDIKVAYKETAQILHPDRFATNKRLQNRATEQFKNLQEAYEYLTSGKGRKESSAAASSNSTPTSRVEAQLSGIAAARIQLVKQRDVILDQRRNGIIMVIIGGIVTFLTSRRPVGIFAMLAAISGAAVVWGIVQIVSSQRTLTTLDEHIVNLAREEKKLKQLL